VYIRFWPTLHIYNVYDSTFGDFPAIYSMYTVFIIYMVLANPTNVVFRIPCTVTTLLPRKLELRNSQLVEFTLLLLLQPLVVSPQCILTSQTPCPYHSAIMCKNERICIVHASHFVLARKHQSPRQSTHMTCTLQFSRLHLEMP
jgi:hypothetical protein